MNENVHGRHESANSAELRLELDILPVFLVGQCAEVGERNVNQLREYCNMSWLVWLAPPRTYVVRSSTSSDRQRSRPRAIRPAITQPSHITPANSMTPRALLQPRTQHNSASTQIHLVFYHYCHFRVPGTVAVGLRVIC